MGWRMAYAGSRDVTKQEAISANMARDLEHGFPGPFGTVQVCNPWPFDHHPRLEGEVWTDGCRVGNLQAVSAPLHTDKDISSTLRYPHDMNILLLDEARTQGIAGPNASEMERIVLASVDDEVILVLVSWALSRERTVVATAFATYLLPSWFFNLLYDSLVRDLSRSWSREHC